MAHIVMAYIIMADNQALNSLGWMGPMPAEPAAAHASTNGGGGHRRLLAAQKCSDSHDSVGCVDSHHRWAITNMP